MSSTTPASPLADLPQPVALVAHDAGAANHLLAWAAQARTLPLVHLQGPAARLWQQRFGTDPAPCTLDEVLARACFLVTGSGWASDVEHEARRRARELGLPAAALVDHWVNYAARFTRGGVTAWPDEFWVTDAEAFALAQQVFAGATVRLQPNAYLAEQLAGITPVDQAPPVLLYVLEPTRTDWGRGTPGEFQALDFLLRQWPALGLPPGTVLRLRPHPSEPVDKYAAWTAGRQGPVRIELDTSPSIGAALSGARWVAGCESYALVVALAAGREVFGTLPPWAPACRLPQAGIRHLRELAPR